MIVRHWILNKSMVKKLRGIPTVLVVNTYPKMSCKGLELEHEDLIGLFVSPSGAVKSSAGGWLVQIFSAKWRILCC